MNRRERQGLGTEPHRRSQSSALNPQSLEIHIDQLVLHGFAPGDRHHIRDAVQRELARVLTERGLPAALAHAAELNRLDAGSFVVSADGGPDAIGAQVAQAVYGGMGR